MNKETKCVKLELKTLQEKLAAGCKSEADFAAFMSFSI
jgi:hypothetical protein